MNKENANCIIMKAYGSGRVMYKKIMMLELKWENVRIIKLKFGTGFQTK